MKQDLDAGQDEFPYHHARLVSAAIEMVFLLHGVIHCLGAIDSDQQGRSLKDIVAGWLYL